MFKMMRLGAWKGHAYLTNTCTHEIYYELWIFNGHCNLVINTPINTSKKSKKTYVPGTLNWYRDVFYGAATSYYKLFDFRLKEDQVYSNKQSMLTSHKSTYNKKKSIGIILDWAGTDECIVRKRKVNEWLYNNGRERKPDYIIYLGMHLMPLHRPEQDLCYADFDIHNVTLSNITNKWNNTKHNLKNNNCLTFCLDYIKNIRKNWMIWRCNDSFETFNIRWSIILLNFVHSKLKNPPCKSVVNVDTDNARVIYCKSRAKPIQETSLGAASR